ncbi:protein HEXIM1 [Erythrolamprus reginae]|uniref:protein HEXIM1 n=1 Tax=Erythrolamprus reginae TaxID=121349 RepID=UPI00396C9C5E
MADAAFSANLRQQPNGKTPFPPCRVAGEGDSGGGGAFLGSPSSNQELLQGREIADRWQPREVAKQQDGRRVGAGVPFPDTELTIPVVGGIQSVVAPGINQIGDQAFVAAVDTQDAEGGEQLDLQEQEYCGDFDPSCRSQSGGEEEKQLAKKKHRRRPSKKKKHWKPYYKLSWEEKKKFDEKQSQRASRLRAEMFAKGQPVAPYNTTQFLMEDHDQEEPDLKTSLYPKRSTTKSDETSEEDFVEEKDGGSDGMGGEGTEFLQKDFSETYERYHVESLQNMSKQELIKEYLELEKCLSKMEDENNRLLMENKKFAGDSTEDPRVSQLEEELDKLRAENQKLLKEIELGKEQENNFSKLGE